MTEFIEHALSQSLGNAETLLRKHFSPEIPLARRGRLIRIIPIIVGIMTQLEEEQEAMIVLQIGDKSIHAYDSIAQLALGPPQDLDADSQLELVRFEPNIINHVATPRVLTPRPYFGKERTLISANTLGQTLVDHGTLGIANRPKLDDSSKNA